MIKSSVCACLPTVSPESLDLTPDLAYDPRRALTLTFARPSSSSQVQASSSYNSRTRTPPQLMSESALLAKLATLNDSLDDLEEKLEPLLAQTLPESLLPLETIQQVKLNVALAYLVYDLIFSASLYVLTVKSETHSRLGTSIQST